MRKATLNTVYELAGEYLLHPDDRRSRRIQTLRARLAKSGASFVEPLLSTGKSDGLWSVREYVETLELAPPCPLYVGTYMFEEPESCRGAAVSDRNPYLLHLENLYRHFGFELESNDLPDFLPIMLDFLRVTDPQGSERDVSIRKYFVREFLRPGLAPMHEQMEEYESPYAPILRAVRSAVDRDLEFMDRIPVWQPTPEAAASGGPSCVERLDTSALPCCGDEISAATPCASSKDIGR